MKSDPEIKAVEIDCKNLRVIRQRGNNAIVVEALTATDLRTATTVAKLKKIANYNEIERILDELEWSIEEFLAKCIADRPFAIVSAGRAAKCASRQGAKDEAYIIGVCATSVKRVGVVIRSLSNTELRPTKDGRILKEYAFRKLNLKKSDCLKSLDAEITGAVRGYIFAKVVFGGGGHQDNVFAEAHQFGKWAVEYGNVDHLYVLLIDTDLKKQFDELREAFVEHEHILVAGHVEFQTYLLNR